MSEDEKLAEALLRENLINQAQLRTAVDFQKRVGGELKEILVKLGYVKDSTLVGILAAQQNMGAAATIEINANVIDMEALRILPRALLEKHQVIPLKGDDPNSLVLAMSDPNNIAAIEEVQFLVRRMVEPAVTPKTAIRKALNRLDELARGAPPGGSPDKKRALLQLPIDRLLRAYILCQVERGLLSADELLARAEGLDSGHGS